MSRTLSLVLTATLLALSACSTKTFEQSEPYTQFPHDIESTEDRIVLALPEQVGTPLSKEYKDYIARFVAYYRDMPHGIFYVSHIKTQEDRNLADENLPAHRPAVTYQIKQVTSVLDGLSIPYHRITEYDDRDEAVVTEENPKDVTVVNKMDDQKKVAVAVIIKKYTVTAAGCVDLSNWSYGRTQTTSMSATGMGCASRQNYLAQMKNPQNVVQGQPMDPEYSTMPFVKLQKSILDGTFEPKVSEDTDSSTTGN